MSAKLFFRLVFLPMILVLAGCFPAASAPPTASQPTPLLQVIAKSIPSTGVRECDYVPDQSIPAQMPKEVLEGQNSAPGPDNYSFTSSPVDAAITNAQMAAYRQIWEDINEYFVFRNSKSTDWKFFWQKYDDIIRKGLKQDDFYRAMKQMLYHLGGQSIGYFSPTEASRLENLTVYQSGLAGIGGRFILVDVGGQPKAVFSDIFPGGPADQAGVKVHDTLLNVNGGPLFDEQNHPLVLGKEGTSVTITVQTTGQAPRDVTLVRRQTAGNYPVEICLVKDTRIAYIRLQEYQAPDLQAQVIEALKTLGAGGPLQGLVIDTRMVTRGSFEDVLSLLSLFTSGEQGSLVSPGQTESYTVVSPLDVAGSQTVPLALLQNDTPDSMSLIFNGLLQMGGRARIVGAANMGPFYTYQEFDLSDRSVLNLPTTEFQPKGRPANSFNRKGVQPDFTIPSRWDLFTESTDPVLARAVQMLMEYDPPFYCRGSSNQHFVFFYFLPHLLETG